MARGRSLFGKKAKEEKTTVENIQTVEPTKEEPVKEEKTNKKIKVGSTVIVNGRVFGGVHFDAPMQTLRNHETKVINIIDGGYEVAEGFVENISVSAK